MPPQAIEECRDFCESARRHPPAAVAADVRPPLAAPGDEEPVARCALERAHC
jgi:hypothetical protein